MKGAEIVINCLLEQNVTSVFGYPGGTILNIYDAMYDYKDKIKHYLTSHEQGAVHAADGYSRASGKVGVCMATSGPGATNLITGLATAYIDSVPLVAITCNVARELLGRDSFQEVAIADIAMPITKYSCVVNSIEELADTIRDCFYIAKEGRPGPVLIDIPKDLTVADFPYTYKEPQKYISSQNFDKKEFLKAIQLLNDAKNPMIMIGGGVNKADAEKQILELSEKLNCPVASTLMGIGSFPQSNDKYTGMVGMHGTLASNYGISNCDILVAVGTRFNDRVTSKTSKFANKTKILHIDIDPAEINKNVKVDCELIGDAKVILQNLLENIEPKNNNDWLEEILKLKKEKVNLNNDKEILNPQFILEYINKNVSDDTLITTEVGQNQMWTAQYYKFDKPKRFITSGGLGTMGFGTGASIGCKVACPNNQVVAIAGDGSFRMNCNELATVENYDLPIIYVILNNHTLGMVRQWQTLFYDKRYSETSLDRGPNFKLLAEAYNIQGFSVSTKQEFELAFKTALKSKKPAVIDCNICIDEFVLPMVAPGKPIDEIINKA